jgi:ATP-dependent protease ClpP protease subunit
MKKVSVKGAIIQSGDQWIYDWFGMDATSPKSVNEAIFEANGDDLEVEINSGGGDVFAGSEIYTTLKSYSGNVTTKIVGLAASAASVIAMAGNNILMSPTGQMMIHNVSTRSSGDYRDMQHASDVLKNANTTIANAYRLKTGMSEADLLNMMNQETWLTPQQALENKFIDEIMFNNGQVNLVASIQSNLLPLEVIEKMRNSKMQSNPLSNKDMDFFNAQKAKAKLNLLKLGGM